MQRGSYYLHILRRYQALDLARPHIIYLCRLELLPCSVASGSLAEKQKQKQNVRDLIDMHELSQPKNKLPA